MNVRALVWIVIVLIVVNIAALGTIVYQRFHYRPWIGEPPGLAEPGMRMARKLKLTREQRQSLFQSRRATDSLLAPLFQTIGERRRMLIDELRGESPDTSMINGLLNEIGVQQTVIARTRIDNFLRDSHSLQPEQRDMLLRLIEERILGNEGREFPRGIGPGRGFGDR